MAKISYPTQRKKFALEEKICGFSIIEIGLSNITVDFILHYGLLLSVLLKLLRILVDCNIALTLVRFFEVV